MSFRSLFFFEKKQRVLNPKFSQNLVYEIIDKVKHNLPKPNLKLFEKDFFDVRRPVFVESAKNINSVYAKSLFLAGLVFPFELVIFYEKLEEISPLKQILKDAKFLNKNILSKNIKAKIYSLNINFVRCGFDDVTSSKILVNNQEVFLKKFKNFQAFENDFFAITETCFLGDYIFIENKTHTKNNYLIKKIIKNNYFILKNNKNNCFFNLLTKEKFFIKCTEKVKVDLKKDKTGKNLVASFCVETCKNFCLYVGKENINVFDKNLKNKILFLAGKSFQNKISSKNKSLENFFNNILPQRILEKKLLGFMENSFEEEKLYYTIKNKVIKFEKNRVVFQRKNKILSFKTKFKGKTKTINFFNGGPKIIVGGQSYCGVSSVSLEIFERFDSFDVYS